MSFSKRRPNRQHLLPDETHKYGGCVTLPATKQCEINIKVENASGQDEVQGTKKAFDAERNTSYIQM